MAGNRKLASIYRKLVKEISLFRRLNLAGKRVAGIGPCALGHVASHQGGDPERRPRHVRPRDGSKDRTMQNDGSAAAPTPAARLNPPTETPRQPC
jgi:hypothetical protein